MGRGRGVGREERQRWFTARSGMWVRPLSTSVTIIVFQVLIIRS